jgi:hypothetical protein
MHRQSSRSTTNVDAIDCNINTNDLALEEEVHKRENDYRSKSRRDQPSKRSNDNTAHRSNRHSPPSVTRKHHPSPPSHSSSRPRHYPSQRHNRASSRSHSPPPPPPPPLAQSSSRHHRPAVSAKRPYPQSESPHGRHHPPIHRSRLEVPSERTTGNAVPTLEERKIPPKEEPADLILVSEDESTKPHDIRSNSTKPNESSSSSSILTNNNQLHSTPSNRNESLLEMSTIPQEAELSILARSALSTMNTSSILTPPRNPTNDLMQTMDLISKYNSMQTIPNANPQIEACSKDILIIIQKQIELQKIELDYRQREIKLRERELAEREKCFQVKSSEPNSTMASVNSEPFIITKPNIIEENISVKAEIPINQDIITISPDESVLKSIPPPIVDTLKIKSTTKSASDQPSVARKTRFSQPFVDPSIFSSQSKPIVELYSDDLNASDQSIPPTIGTDLKITSSSTCRKVEIQSGNIDKTGSKESSSDLRLTLGKIRTKQQTNDEYGTNGGEPTINDLESTLKNNDNKQQSHDYQQQRSVTSTSIETIIDDNNDKRDVRRHRQQPPSNTNQRSYTHGSTSKYGSNPKRYENDDLRSRIFDHKQPKPPRTTHKNNY